MSFNLTKYSSWCTLAYSFFMASLFMPIRFNSLSILILCFITIIGFASHKITFQKLGYLWILPLMFLTLVIGLIYTENMDYGKSIIERNLGFLVFPFITLPITKISATHQRLLFNIFLLSSAALSIYCLGIAIQFFLETGSAYLNDSTHFVYNVFMHQLLTEPAGMHAIYFSLYLAFGGSVIVYLLANQKVENRSTKTLYIGYLLFSTFLLFLLKSSNFALVYPLTLFGILGLRYRTQLLKKASHIIAAIVLLISVITFSFNIISTKLESLEIETDYSSTDMRPLSLRMAIWSNSIDVIKKDWIKGSGTGDSEDELTKAYQESNFTIGLESNFNSHNMFLQYWMSNGVVMVLLYILILALSFWYSLKYKQYLLTIFLILFTSFSLTESTLQTQRGIIFFLFLMCAFYWEKQLFLPSKDNQ